LLGDTLSFEQTSHLDRTPAGSKALGEGTLGDDETILRHTYPFGILGVWTIVTT
jgi:hypothetical protein